MSTQDARMSAAEVLGQHIYSTLWYMCSCSGWEGDTITVDEFAAHQLDALKAAGYADPVKLPDAYEDQPDVKHPYWVGNHPGAFVAYAQAGGVWLETDAKFHALTPDDARAFAAALLAAANRIETTAAQAAAEADR